MKFQNLLFSVFFVMCLQSHAQVFYRVASNFDQIQLDNVPAAKSTVAIEYNAVDSVKMVGKVFYRHRTKVNRTIYMARDRSKLCFYADDDLGLDGFIVTAPPKYSEDMKWSVYYRYVKKNKAQKIPEEQDGMYERDDLREIQRWIIDRRARTYYTVFWNPMPKINNATRDFIFVSQDTIRTEDDTYFSKLYFRNADNFFGGSNLYLFQLDNGAIVERDRNHNYTAYFAPTKAMADEMVSQEFNPKNDVIVLDAKAESYGRKLEGEWKARDDKKKEEQKKGLIADVSAYVAGLKSLRKEPVLEQSLRKRLTTKEYPTISVSRVYFLDETWQIVTNYYDQIVNKRLACVVVFKDSKDGSCYMKYWNIQYPYMGSGTYATEFELGTTYPSKRNTSTQDSWLRVDDSLSDSFHNIYAGNSYDLDCKVIK